ncbi:MAG: hypothetical protein F6K21_06825, partial [Symploca sp. SIO2D2]|nr:hypothetical protein [Symploca sp. SIO2D2]
MVDSTDTNFKWEYCLTKDGYTLYQAGSHRNGDLIQLLVPNHPYQKQGKLKLITYLHGFALCMPLFYEQHLARLAKQGYYVLFPDFQRSTYPNDPETKDSSPDKVQKAPLRFWLDILTATIAQRDRSEVEDTFNQQPKEGSKVRSLA